MGRGFLKFQSQAWHTDDRTGHTIAASAATLPATGPAQPVQSEPPTTEDPQGLVRILAALVNPVQSPEIEKVTLINTAPHTIALDGWALLDTQKKRLPLSGSLTEGATLVVTVTQPFALSNKGGVITLVDDKGLKVDGVSYTQAQAQHPGWTIVF
jgi:hypothetical protein